jgi:hypothetical protein
LTALFNVIRSIEQGREFNGSVHNDGAGVPTLGYGYAMLVKGVNEQWVSKASLNTDLSAIDITLTPLAVAGGARCLSTCCHHLV